MSAVDLGGSRTEVVKEKRPDEVVSVYRNANERRDRGFTSTTKTPKGETTFAHRRCRNEELLLDCWDCVGSRCKLLNRTSSLR